jgi:hypothetical protein
VNLQQPDVASHFKSGFGGWAMVVLLNLRAKCSLHESGSLLVMEVSFKPSQTCHDREWKEIAKERYPTSDQTWADTHPASPKVIQTRSTP